MNLTNVKNIIFDLGDVIINIDPPRSIAAFAKRTSRQANDTANDFLTHGFFAKYERGELTEEQFYDWIKEALPYPFGFQHFADDWNVLLLDIPPQRLSLLQQLRKKYKLFLLSNTNDTHIRAVNKLLAGQHGTPGGLSAFFDKVYLSYKMGLIKPDPAIYRKVLSDSCLKAEETLFFDDNADNIAAARTTGIQAVQIIPHRFTISDAFETHKH